MSRLRKTPCMEGTGFSPYINLSRMNGALAPEGRFLLPFARCSRCGQATVKSLSLPFPTHATSTIEDATGEE